LYALEFYEDESGNEPVLAWLRQLAPRKRRAIGVAMFEILQHEGPHVVGTNFGKALGGGLFEFRLDQDAAAAGLEGSPASGAGLTILVLTNKPLDTRKAMATKFSEFMAEVKREAKAEGPEAVAELKYYRERFRLARRFAEARQKRGWTQKKLADKTGLNQADISMLENGQANPTYRTLQLLASALGGKIDLVFG
jgi:DNA-binding XRE family transcriptional regulator